MPIPIARCSLRAIIIACAVFCGLIEVRAIRAQESPAAKAGDPPASCPVTKPEDAFVPPYKIDPPPGSIFVGTAKLWTLVWIHSWQGRKLVWWSPGDDLNTTSPPGLTVTLARLDVPATVLVTDHSNWAQASGAPFITTGVKTSPDAGCWEITGRMKGNEVKYVVWLGPGTSK